MMTVRSTLIALAALCMPVPVQAACSIGKLADLPVTMAGRTPMITARLNGRDARFILDSGAGYSTISLATANDYGMKVTDLPPWFRMQGVGGDVSAGAAIAKDFVLSGIPIPKVEFIVAGSDTGTQGLIGQNILGIRDIEYDLPHSAVRLIESKGCGKLNLAYWAGDRPVTMLPLINHEARGPFNPHTVAWVTLNGRKLRAIFDTGAGTSILSLEAAKRAGVTPSTPGVVRAGYSRGLGTRQSEMWIAPFDKIDIGGEAIPSPKIRIAELNLGDQADMLIGIDFFLSHRVLVSNAAAAMYVTYEGGSVFGLSPSRALSSDGKVINLNQATAEPADANGFSRRGAMLLSSGKLDDALAALNKAIALNPAEGRTYRQRAAVRLARHETELALADLGQAISHDPSDAEARLQRAELEFRTKNKSRALEDVRAADASLTPGAEMRLSVAGLYDQLGQPEAALRNVEVWLKSHPEDSSRANALNARCWSLGQLNRDLDSALKDCNTALKLRPATPAYLDSRALVYLRRGELDKALGDYNLAIQRLPSSAWSIYARGLVEQRTGKTAQASADRAAALKLDPEVLERAKAIGLQQ